MCPFSYGQHILPLCPFLCSLKVAQADLKSPELAWSSSTEDKETQNQLRSSPRAISPPWGASLSRALSPASLDPALWVVQAAIDRRRQREQVGSHSPLAPEIKLCPISCPAELLASLASEPHSPGRGLWS
jgi:hypothetical protein